MAKSVVVAMHGKVSSFHIEKLDRSRLYGKRRRVPIDGEGRLCTRAALTSDGAVLLRSGMTAQGWFDADGRQVEHRDIGAIDDTGVQLELVPSTLGVEQALEGPIDPREVLDLELTAVYMAQAVELDAELSASLERGEAWRLPFNYRPDHRAETGYLIQNETGRFILVGTPATPAFLEPASPPPQEDDGEDDGDLDFEML
jgi:hypothetical protein